MTRLMYLQAQAAELEARWRAAPAGKAVAIHRAWQAAKERAERAAREEANKQ